VSTQSKRDMAQRVMRAISQEWKDVRQVAFDAGVSEATARRYLNVLHVYRHVEFLRTKENVRVRRAK